MISHFINEPDHWRARAEEARMLANQMNDSESRDAMLRIAEDYERLATRAEDRTVGRRFCVGAGGTLIKLVSSCEKHKRAAGKGGSKFEQGRRQKCP
jgi:hypothetical protein